MLVSTTSRGRSFTETTRNAGVALDSFAWFLICWTQCLHGLRKVQIPLHYKSTCTPRSHCLIPRTPFYIWGGSGVGTAMLPGACRKSIWCFQRTLYYQHFLCRCRMMWACPACGRVQHIEQLIHARSISLSWTVLSLTVEGHTCLVLSLSQCALRCVYM